MKFIPKFLSVALSIFTIATSNADYITDNVTVTGGTFGNGTSFKGQAVSTFKIGTKEITFADWQTVRTYAAANGFDIGSAGSGSGSTNPVEKVSWYDAVKWCNAASLLNSKTPVYTNSLKVSSITRSSTTATVNTLLPHNRVTGDSVTISGAVQSSYNITANVTVVNAVTFTYTVAGSPVSPATGTIVATGTYKSGEEVPAVNASANGYRLPTEKEWEWAAIGGTLVNTPLPFAFAGSNDPSGVCWSQTNSPTSTQPVATKTANQLSIYDMSGNVFEWCFDDITGVVGRRIRGGGWTVNADSCRIDNRGYPAPQRQENGFGLRITTNP